MNTSLNDIVAYLSVRSIGKKSLFAGDAKINAKTVQQFTSSPSDSRRAVGRMMDMGFEVSRVSPISMRVRGPARLFRKKFGLNFERQSEAASKMYTPTAETDAKCLDLGAAELEGISFPQPLELHGKKKKLIRPKRAAKKKATRKNAATLAGGVRATPPTLGYYHLNVARDIVNALNAKPVHRAGNKGQGVRAAMIDSGFQWSHPYFQRKGYKLSVALPAGSDADASGHGTGESANFLSIAPKAKLYGLSMADPIQAFAMCRQSLGVQIISNSWGSRLPTDGPMSSWDPYWAQVLAEISLCVASGIVVLFSGGNGQMSITASSPDTISVGGVYQAEDGTLQASDYASSFDSFRYSTHPRKKEVHVPEVCGLCGMQPQAIYIALPIPAGCQIDRSLGGGTFPQKDETAKNDGWGVFSGTSAACPMTAGVVALILNQYPDANLAEVRKRLYRATDVTTGQSSHGDLAAAGYDDATGYGLVDAQRAVAP